MSSWTDVEMMAVGQVLAAGAILTHLMVLRPRAARRDLVLDARLIQDELDLAERTGQVVAPDSVAVHQLLRRIRQNPRSAAAVLERIPDVSRSTRARAPEPDVEYLVGALDRLDDAGRRYLRIAWPLAGGGPVTTERTDPLDRDEQTEPAADTGQSAQTRLDEQTRRDEQTGQAERADTPEQAERADDVIVLPANRVGGVFRGHDEGDEPNDEWELLSSSDDPGDTPDAGPGGGPAVRDRGQAPKPTPERAVPADVLAATSVPADLLVADGPAGIDLTGPRPSVSDLDSPSWIDLVRAETPGPPREREHRRGRGPDRHAGREQAPEVGRAVHDREIVTGTDSSTPELITRPGIDPATTETAPEPAGSDRVSSPQPATDRRGRPYRPLRSPAR